MPIDSKTLKSACLVLLALAVQTNPCLGKTKSHKPKADLPNFHEVHPFLYRGGEPTERGLEELKKMGVTTLIDLRNPGELELDERRLARKLDMKYISMPMSSKAPTKRQIDKFVKTIEAVSEEKCGDDALPAKVFVHCAHGSDRTGCMIGLWRVTHDNWTYDQAYKEMRKYYFGPKYTKLSGTVKQHAHN